MSAPVTTNVGLLEHSIQLASCGCKEVLPMTPGLPADLFTSCLTTPVKTALLWYCQHKIGHLSLVNGLNSAMIDKYGGWEWLVEVAHAHVCNMAQPCMCGLWVWI